MSNTQPQSICLKFMFPDSGIVENLCPNHPIKDDPHVTLLYIGKHAISNEQFESLKVYLMKHSAPISWKIVSARKGDWGTVVFFDLEFETLDDEQRFEAMYKNAWEECDKLGIVPQMTNALRNKHPGCHMTLGFGENEEDALLLELQYKETFASYIGKTISLTPCLSRGNTTVSFK